MPIDAASGTSAIKDFSFPTGKPTWVLVRSAKEPDGKSMDAIYYKMKSKFAGKINFRILNWEGPQATVFSVDNQLDAPPASVLADSNGHVVKKFEGKKISKDMSKMLETLLAEGKKR